MTCLCWANSNYWLVSASFKICKIFTLCRKPVKPSAFMKYPLVPWDNDYNNGIVSWRYPANPSTMAIGNLASIPRIRHFRESSFITTLVSNYSAIFTGFKTIKNLGFISMGFWGFGVLGFWECQQEELWRGPRLFKFPWVTYHLSLKLTIILYIVTFHFFFNLLLDTLFFLLLFIN